MNLDERLKLLARKPGLKAASICVTEKYRPTREAKLLLLIAYFAQSPLPDFLFKSQFLYPNFIY